MKLIVSFFLLLITTSVSANQVLIPYFSKWKYLDNGSNQGTSWIATSFIDTSWKSNYAPLGYGDGDERTVISYGPSTSNKYVTTYFRKAVNITNILTFANFTFNVRRDDGIVVYINGVEAFRNNMVAAPTLITYNTLALADAADDGNTPQVATISSSFFTNGNNVIAVEVHQRTSASTDLTFDLELVGNQASSPVLSRGPYLQVATPTSIRIRWRTSAASNSRIYYGLSPTSLFSQFNDPSSITEHNVQITGLTPNTKYYYAIGSSTALLMGDDENYFITPPVTGTIKPTRVWVTGDFGSGTVNSDGVRNAYQNYTADTYTDCWLWLGDNAYSNGTEVEYTNYVFNYRYESMFKKTCAWPSPGNHDYAQSGYQSAASLGTSVHYFTAFTTPQLAEAGGIASNTPKYYSYNYGNIHFISLDSYGALNTAGSPMYNWLQNDLTANTQKWTIVYFHHAPYSKGSHDSDTEIELVNMRTNIVPLLESFKVDLVLAGHSHSYERSFLIRNHFGDESTFATANKVSGTSGTNPTPYIKSNTNSFIGTVYAVVGCSGQTVGGTSTDYPHNAMVTSDVAIYGSMVIDINGDTLNAKLVTNNLVTPTIFEQFTILKQCSLTVTLSPFAACCTNASPLTLTGGSPAGGSYSGPGVTAGVFNAATAGAGTHNIMYTYTDAFGCSATASQSIVVNTAGVAAVTVAITTGGNPSCTGAINKFTATPFNGGVTPIYQWKKNGSNAGTNSAVYTDANLVTGNTVQCIMTNNASCITGSPASSSLITMTVNNCNTTFNLKVLLEGFYNSFADLMVPLLFNSGLNVNANATDSITIRLYDDVSPYILLESKNALLLNTGQATAQFLTAIPGHTYYIAVRHRNSLETWSKNPVLFSGSPVSFDFTTP